MGEDAAKAARPAFRRVLTDGQKGLVILPLLKPYLWEARFPKTYSVTFDQPTHRKPDGWFHPSQHPLWSPRMLWLWNRHPELAVPEPLGIEGALSVTMGKAMHSFMDVCLIDLGIMVANNVPVISEETHSKGEMDGVLDLSKLRKSGFPTEVAWEFKTGNVFALQKLNDLDLDYYKERWPHYWAQNQDYLRMSGYTVIIVVFLSLGYPWELREVHVERDEGFIAALDKKYRDVLAADSMPQACCSPQTTIAKECVMRHACPIGKISVA